MGNAAWLAVLLPFAGAILVGLVGSPRAGAIISLFVVALTSGLTVAAPFGPGGGLLHADALGLGFGVLTGFVALTTAVQNLHFVQAGLDMSVRRWRLYHALRLAVLGAVLLGLYADNIGLLWLSMEIATIAAGLAAILSAAAAGRRGFILGGAGLALALFGTILVYLAAQPALGPGLPTLSFAALSAHAAALNGPVLTLAFIFLLFGYGTMVAFMSDAYAQGLTLNVALIAILRFRHLAAQHANTGPLLLGLGLACLALPAVSMARRRDARRFFGDMSIAQSGLALFAFGIGGAAAIFGGLLVMALNSLITSAGLQALIRAGGRRGGAMLGAALFALAGLPPSGLFAADFIIISQTAQRSPWLAAPLGLLLLLCGMAALRRIGPLVRGPAPEAPAGWDMGLSALHLVAAFGLAFFMPPALVALMSGVAAALS